MDDQMLSDAFDDLLTAHCSMETVREIEAGGTTAPLWEAIAQSGFADALVAEQYGGAGLALRHVFPLVVAAGAHLLPLPFGETMIARALLTARGAAAGDDATTLDAAGLVNEAASAAVTAAMMAGAMQRMLDLSIAYANDRAQFGKPIGKFQAVQQQLAVMAEQVAAVRLAAALAFDCRGPLPALLPAALAKARASEAVPVVTSIAHGVHGAIGMTAEFDLQLYSRRLYAWRQAHGGELYWQRKIGAALIACGGDFLTFTREAFFCGGEA